MPGSRTRTTSLEEAKARFGELVAAAPPLFAECMIELEDRRGRVRIQLKNVSASYVATLSRNLLESAS